MKTYIFKTTATMKAYNQKNWWIDGGIVSEKKIEAENLKNALNKYAEMLEEQHYISISKSALKNKSAMYVDTKSGEAKQVGYVITGKTEFQRDDYTWSTQYIDLWVSIIEAVEVEF